MPENRKTFWYKGNCDGQGGEPFVPVDMTPLSITPAATGTIRIVNCYNARVEFAEQGNRIRYFDGKSYELSRLTPILLDQAGEPTCNDGCP